MPFNPRHRLRTLAAAALLSITALAPVTAQAGSSEWSGQVTLYGWGAGVTGDFRPFPGAPRLSFDRSFSDVLKDSDGAFFMTALARRGDLVFFLLRLGCMPLLLLLVHAFHKLVQKHRDNDIHEDGACTKWCQPLKAEDMLLDSANSASAALTDIPSSQYWGDTHQK